MDSIDENAQAYEELNMKKSSPEDRVPYRSQNKFCASPVSDSSHDTEGFGNLDSTISGVVNRISNEKLGVDKYNTLVRNTQKNTIIQEKGNEIKREKNIENSSASPEVKGSGSSNKCSNICDLKVIDFNSFLNSKCHTSLKVGMVNIPCPIGSLSPQNKPSSVKPQIKQPRSDIENTSKSIRHQTSTEELISTMSNTISSHNEAKEVCTDEKEVSSPCENSRETWTLDRVSRLDSSERENLSGAINKHSAIQKCSETFSTGKIHVIGKLKMGDITSAKVC